MTDVDEFQRAMALFREACALEEPQRTEFISQRCGADSALHTRVRAMLRQDRSVNRPVDAAAGVRLLAMNLTMGATRGPVVSMAPHAFPVLAGDYRILRLIGEGGMGAVYEAEQGRPRRIVALKMIRPGLASVETLRRFEREADILGRLHHPGIAQVYEFGAADVTQPDQAYIAMEYVHGDPLTAFAERAKLNVRQRIELFIKIGDAIQHAHQRGVIHRDLKPANILVVDDTFSRAALPADSQEVARREVSAARLNVQPKILDFGVARALTADGQRTQRTHAGQLIGTIQYMSPEQVAGDPDAVDVRSDVYALGVLLAELLSGRLPHDFESKSLPECARIIRDETPRRLGELNRALRGDLETIVAKTLEKDPARRYASAADLAADLQRYLAGEPIAARRDSAFYIVRKQLQRYRGIVALSAATLALLAVIASAALWQAHVKAQLADSERSAKQEALAARDRASRLANDLTSELATNRVERGRLMGLTGKFRTAEDMLWREYLHQPESRLAHWALWELYAHFPCLATLPGPKVAYAAIACSPDGALVAAAGRARIIRIWSAATLEPVADLEPIDDEITRLVFSPDSKTLIAGSVTGRIERWRVSDRQREAEWATGLPRIKAFALSHDGHLLAVGGIDSTAQLWSVASGQRIREWQTGAGWINAFAFSPDDTKLASADSDGFVKFWNVDLGEASGGLPKLASAATSLAYSKDGRTLAVGKIDEVLCFDVASAAVVKTLPVPGESTFELGFMPDETHLIAGQEALSVFDMPEGRPRGPLVASRAGSLHFASMRASSRVFVASGDGDVRIWELAPLACRRPLREASNRTMRIAFAPSSGMIVTCRWNGLDVWPSMDSATPRRFEAHRGWVRGLAFSRDGRRMVTGASDSLIKLWDTSSLECVQTISTSGQVGALALDHSENFIVSAGGKQAITLWRLPEGQLADELPDSVAPAGTVGLRVSPNGELLASGAEGQPVRLWDLHECELRATLGDKPHLAGAIAFSPDGRQLATANWKGEIELWDVATAAKTAALVGHGGIVLTLAYAPDGRTLASGSQRGEVKLWDVAAQQCLATLVDHGGEIACLQFDATGRWLASAGDSDATAIWDLTYYDQHIRGHRAWFEQKFGAAAARESAKEQ